MLENVGIESYIFTPQAHGHHQSTKLLHITLPIDQQRLESGGFQGRGLSPGEW